MSELSENDILGEIHEFLLQYAEDKEAGKVLSLRQYQARHPGLEDEIAREFRAITRAGKEPAEEAGDAGEAGEAADARDAGEVEAPPFLEKLGQYRVLKELGHGGQGVVYLAEDTRLHRKVALKVLSSRSPMSLSLRSRFRREAETASRLEHPGICTVYEASEIDGVPFIAMQYIEGESLARKIAAAWTGSGPGSCVHLLDSELQEEGSDGPGHGEGSSAFRRRSLMAACELIESAARAVHTAHAAGIIHRDLKPANIMVTAEGRPVILDFGLAQDEEDQSLTRTGDLLGTPAYLPPERLQGQGQGQGSGLRATAETDVYALGATLYECLTLCRPFEAPTRDALYRKILGEEVSSASQHNPLIPPDLQLVMETALEKDPKRRYATALGFAEDLRRVRQHLPIVARPTPLHLRARRWLQRNPAVATSVLAIMLVLTVGLVVSWGLLASRNEALEETRVQTLVAKSASLEVENPVLSLLLAREAVKRRKDPETISQLLSALSHSHQVAEFEAGLEPGPGHFSGLAIALPSPNGKRILTAQHTGVVRLWWTDRPKEYTPYPRVAKISSAAFSPKGAFFATFCRNGHVYVWDFNGKQLADLPHDGNQLPAGRLLRYRGLVAFSPDGELLLAGTSKGVARLWRWREKRCIHEFREHSKRIAHVAFSPLGDCVATASQDKTACLYTLSQGGIGEPTVLGKHTAPVRWVAFSPDGLRVVTAGVDGTALLWNLEGKHLATMQHHGATVWTAVFSPDSQKILTASRDQMARLWDLEGRLLQTFSHTSVPYMAMFSPDGESVLTATYSGRAHLFDLLGRRLLVLSGHRRTLCSAFFSSDGRQILTSSWDGTARLWDLEVPGFSVLRGHRHAVSTADISPDGRFLVSGGGDGTIWLWDLENRWKRTPLGEPFESLVFSASFSSDGSRIMAAAEYGHLRVWERQRQVTDFSGCFELILDEKPIAPQILEAVFSPKDRDTILVASGKLFLCHLDRYLAGRIEGRKGRKGRKGKKRRQWWSILSDKRRYFGSAAFSPDGKRVVGGARDTNLYLYDLGREKNLPQAGRPLPGHHASVLSVAFAPPDGKLIASGANDIMLWNQEGKRLAPLRGHHEVVRSLRFSSDGERLLSASDDGSAKLWDLEQETPKPLLTLRGHDGIVWSAQFVPTPDGTKIMTTGSDRTIRFWPVGCEDLQELAEKLLKMANKRVLRDFMPEERETYKELLLGNR